MAKVVYLFTPMAKAPEDLPNRIRTLRKQRGMTLEQLGAAIGMTKAGVGHLETGTRPLGDHHRFAIARALGVDVADTFLPEQTPHTIPPGERSFFDDYFALPAPLRAAVREHTRQLREWGAEPSSEGEPKRA